MGALGKRSLSRAGFVLVGSAMVISNALAAAQQASPSKSKEKDGESRQQVSSDLPGFRIQRTPFRQVLVTRTERFAKGLHAWVAHLVPPTNHNQTVSGIAFYLNGKEVKVETAPTIEGNSTVAFFRVDSDEPVEIMFASRAVLAKSRLVPGRAEAPALSDSEKKEATVSRYPEIYDTKEFRKMLVAEELLRFEGETKVAFIRRMATWFDSRMTYLTHQPKNDAFGIITGGGGQCNQLNAAFTTIMRANGIPARCYPGYLGNTHASDVTGHMNSEVWLEGIGWISTDAVRLAKNPKGKETLGVQDDPILMLGVGALTTWKAPSGQVTGGFNWRHFGICADNSAPAKLTYSLNKTVVERELKP